jgi:hypothetical protein
MLHKYGNRYSRSLVSAESFERNEVLYELNIVGKVGSVD